MIVPVKESVFAWISAFTFTSSAYSVVFSSGSTTPSNSENSVEAVPTLVSSKVFSNTIGSGEMPKKITLPSVSCESFPKKVEPITALGIESERTSVSPSASNTFSSFLEA